MAAVLVWEVLNPSGETGRAEGLDYTVFAAGSDMVESYWGRIKGKVNKADVVVGIYCRSASQDVGTDLLLCKDLAPHPKSVVLVLPLQTVEFSLPASYEPLLNV